VSELHAAAGDSREEEAVASGDASGPSDSGAGAPPEPSRETRGERAVRHGRRVRLYTSAALLVALVVVLVLLASANTAAVKLDWVIGSTHASLVWIILAASVLGWLLGITTALVVRHRTRRPR
jgi:uncharacterized integral membrane protein